MEDKKRFEQNQIFNTKYLIRDVFDLATLKELHEDIEDAIISKEGVTSTILGEYTHPHQYVDDNDSYHPDKDGYAELNELYLEELHD